MSPPARAEDPRLVFARRFLPAADRVETLAGEASTRRYHRARAGAAPGRARSIVIMELAADDPGRGGDLPFLDSYKYLKSLDFPVPSVIGEELSAGFLALEDLGDTMLETAAGSALPAARRPYYERAIDLVVRLQALGRERPPAPGHPARERRFDEALLRWELEHFREWLLEADRGAQLDAAEAATVAGAFGRIAGELAAAPPALVHRDFQSRNLMVVDGELRVIDFQDLMQGPRVYDLVALLRDSYVELLPGEVDALLERYAAASGVAEAAARAELRRLFDLQTVQRKLKDAGRFVFIDKQRGNPAFRRFIPTSLGYAREALTRLPELADLHAVLAAHVPELR